MVWSVHTMYMTCHVAAPLGLHSTLLLHELQGPAGTSSGPSTRGLALPSPSSGSLAMWFNRGLVTSVMAGSMVGTCIAGRFDDEPEPEPLCMFCRHICSWMASGPNCQHRQAHEVHTTCAFHGLQRYGGSRERHEAHPHATTTTHSYCTTASRAYASLSQGLSRRSSNNSRGMERHNQGHGLVVLEAQDRALCHE